MGFFSVSKVDIPDNQYYGIWSSSNLKIYLIPDTDSARRSWPVEEHYLTECKVNTSIKSIGTKVDIDVIGGIAYINIDTQERRELKLNLLCQKKQKIKS